MKKLTIAFIAGITLSSFGFNKPWKVQRRLVVVNVNNEGKRSVKIIGKWENYIPMNDTCFEYKTY